MTPIECMEEAIKTFQERHKVYGNNYLTHGQVMTALFPEGIKLQTVEDWNRFNALNLIVVKLTRYCHSFVSPHADSILDLGVYSCMLGSLDDSSPTENESVNHIWANAGPRWEDG
jgi:hypothetical protein